MKNNCISGAEAVMKSLTQEGVDTIFGYPGGAIVIEIKSTIYWYGMNKGRYMLLRVMQEVLER